MNVYEFVNLPVVQRLGWTLLHLLWQAAAIAGVLALVMFVMRRRSPQVRYLAAIFALAAVLAAGVVTFTLLTPAPVAHTHGTILPPADATATDEVRQEAPVLNSGLPIRPTSDETQATSPLDVATGTAAPSGRVTLQPDAVPSGQDSSASRVESANDSLVATSGVLSSWDQGRRALEPHLPAFVAAWLLGVIALSLWRTGGWVAAMRLRAIRTSPVDGGIEAMAQKLAQRLKIARPIRILQSAVAQTPMVIGWLRPVILLPISAITGLTPSQLEAILSHELAHIRRHDYLVNLLQTLVETLLFYHPAVWWISRRIRLERERCCDDTAVHACGDRINYAQALVAVEEARSARAAQGERCDTAAATAVAARGPGGADFVGRIRRILGMQPHASATSIGSVAVALVLLAALCIVPLACSLMAGAPAAKQSSAVTQPAAQPAMQAGTQPAFNPNTAVDRWVRQLEGPDDWSSLWQISQSSASSGGPRGPDSNGENQPLSDELFHTPPISWQGHRSLDEWLDVLPKMKWSVTAKDDNWVFLRTRGMNIGDVECIERIERNGRDFTITMRRVAWTGELILDQRQGRIFGLKLGPLEAGEYRVKWIVVPYQYKEKAERSLGSGQEDAAYWPKSITPTPGTKAKELTTRFEVVPAPAPIKVRPGEIPLEGMLLWMRHVMPPDWDVLESSRVSAAPVGGTEAHGLRIVLQQTAFHAKLQTRIVVASIHIWIMDRDYMARSPQLVGGDRATAADSVVEIGHLQGRRVFVSPALSWGNAAQDIAMAIARVDPDFPTSAANPGRIYTRSSGYYHWDGRWEYTYQLTDANGAEERRTGLLMLDGEKVAAQIGDRIYTPWGLMQFTDDGANQGWLVELCGGKALDVRLGRLLMSAPAQQRRNVLLTKSDALDLIVSVPQQDGDVSPGLFVLAKSGAQPRTPWPTMTADQAKRVIGYLADSGLLARARDGVSWPKVPACVISLRFPSLITSQAIDSYRIDLGWGPAVIPQLRGLATVLEGDAQRRMEILIHQLESQALGMDPSSRSATAPAATQPASAPAEQGSDSAVTIDIKPGQYLFVGLDADKTDVADDSDSGVAPLGRFHVIRNVAVGDWSVRIAAPAVTAADAAKAWEFRMALQVKGDHLGDNRIRERIELRKRVAFPTAPVKPMVLEKVNVSKQMKVEGLQYYRIPYAEVSSQSRFIVVAIADNIAAIRSAIPVSTRQHALFNWDDGWGATPDKGDILYVIPDEDDLAAYIDTYYKGPGYDYIRQPLKALNDFPKPWSLAKVLIWYEEAKDPAVRAGLLRLMAVGKHPKAALVLGQALTDSAAQVRQAAMDGLIRHYMPKFDNYGVDKVRVEATTKWWANNRAHLVTAAQSASQPASAPAATQPTSQPTSQPPIDRALDFAPVNWVADGLKWFVPAEWQVGEPVRGQVQPKGLAKGKGWHVTAERKVAGSAGNNEDKGGIVHIWVMDPAYAGSTSLPATAPVDKAQEIATWHGCRVFISGQAGDWPMWRDDVRYCLEGTKELVCDFLDDLRPGWRQIARVKPGFAPMQIRGGTLLYVDQKREGLLLDDNVVAIVLETPRGQPHPEAWQVVAIGKKPGAYFAPSEGNGDVTYYRPVLKKMTGIWVSYKKADLPNIQEFLVMAGPDSPFGPPTSRATAAPTTSSTPATRPATQPAATDEEWLKKRLAGFDEAFAGYSKGWSAEPKLPADSKYADKSVEELADAIVNNNDAPWDGMEQTHAFLAKTKDNANARKALAAALLAKVNEIRTTGKWSVCSYQHGQWHTLLMLGDRPSVLKLMEGEPLATCCGCDALMMRVVAFGQAEDAWPLLRHFAKGEAEGWLSNLNGCMVRLTGAKTIPLGAVTTKPYDEAFRRAAIKAWEDYLTNAGIEPPQPASGPAPATPAATVTASQPATQRAPVAMQAGSASDQEVWLKAMAEFGKVHNGGLGQSDGRAVSLLKLVGDAKPTSDTAVFAKAWCSFVVGKEADAKAMLRTIEKGSVAYPDRRVMEAIIQWQDDDSFPVQLVSTYTDPVEAELFPCGRSADRLTFPKFELPPSYLCQEYAYPFFAADQYALMGRHQDAIRLYWLAIGSLDDHDWYAVRGTNVWKSMGREYLALGENAKALACFHKAIASGADASDLQDELALLGKKPATTPLTTTMPASAKSGAGDSKRLRKIIDACLDAQLYQEAEFAAREADKVDGAVHALTWKVINSKKAELYAKVLLDAGEGTVFRGVALTKSAVANVAETVTQPATWPATKFTTR